MKHDHGLEGLLITRQGKGSVYISPWLISVSLILIFVYFKFIRKNVPASSQFIGRHQKLLELKEFLGEKLPELERQIAINNDNSEHSGIVQKIEEIEQYIKSADFSNNLDVRSANEKIAEILNETIKTSVLEFDGTLKNRCLKIFDSTNEHIVYSLRSSGESEKKFEDLSKQIKALWNVEGLVAFIKLGGLLDDDSYEQSVWLVMNSLIYSSDVISASLSLFAPEVSQKHANRLMGVSKTLAKQGKIEQKSMNRIEKEIKEGLSYSQQNFAQAK